jgi:small subunit ribosomal protein S7
MPRRAVVTKREVLPDPKYKSRQVSKFIAALMKWGKKSVAERMFYNALAIIEDKTKQDPLKVFKKAQENVRPVLEVKSRRVGGSTYQVPIEVKVDRRETLGNRWLIQFARDRPEKSMSERLAAEIMDAFNNRGGSIKKREDTHKMAEANKAFAHYRW